MSIVEEFERRSRPLSMKCGFWLSVHAFFEGALYSAIAACFISLVFQLHTTGGLSLLVVFISAAVTLLSRLRVRIIREQIDLLVAEIKS